MKSDSSEIILALGSNIDDRLENLNRALTELEKVFGRPKAVSSIYESIAVDYLEQPNFFNLVVIYEVAKVLNPLAILKTTQSIEKKLGRIKLIPKGPRNIDIDILFIGDTNYNDDELTIPHASIYHRDFVYYPLKEIEHLASKRKIITTGVPPLNRLKIIKALSTNC